MLQESDKVQQEVTQTSPARNLLEVTSATFVLEPKSIQKVSEQFYLFGDHTWQGSVRLKRSPGGESEDHKWDAGGSTWVSPMQGKERSPLCLWLWPYLVKEVGSGQCGKGESQGRRGGREQGGWEGIREKQCRDEGVRDSGAQK